MKKDELSAALSSLVGNKLADEIAEDFVRLRGDASTRTLNTSSVGKFVESFVQCLQYMATGKWDEKPSVDAYLDKVAENQLAIPEGLRVCAPRMARAMYTLRNKRNIAHKNPVDANSHDLVTAHQCGAWIMSEMLREATGLSMEQAGVLVGQVQAPVGVLVEEIEGVRLVHASVSIKEETIILLHSHYPEKVAKSQILATMSARSPKSVGNDLAALVRDKVIFGNPKDGYRLTQEGMVRAVGLVRKLADSKQAAA
jgi:hypothetical protein